MFGIPSVVLVGGIWKTGKTDFALLIAEKCLDLGLVKEVASNIDTKGHFPMITDLVTLRHWLYATNKRKLFILDEGNVHLMSRRAMSGKNVKVVSLLGEISKAHARMILIAQELLRVDKEFLNPTWVRGVFIKRNLKKAQLVSHLLPKPSYMIRDIPPTSIPFDPYAVAPFTEQPADQVMFKDEDMQKLWLWTEGSSWRDLEFNHPQQFNRWLKKQVKKLQTIELSHITSNSGEDGNRTGFVMNS